jgi:hypothetical protein
LPARVSSTILVRDLEADLSAKHNQIADQFVGCAYAQIRREAKIDCVFIAFNQPV